MYKQERTVTVSWQFSAQEISNSLWAFGTLKTAPAERLELCPQKEPYKSTKEPCTFAREISKPLLPSREYYTLQHTLYHTLQHTPQLTLQHALQQRFQHES